MDISSNLGIVSSDYADIDLPNCNVWTYLHPFFQEYAKLPYLACSKSYLTYSYENVYEYSLRWAYHLKHLFGNGQPPTVSVICKNHINYPILFLGAQAVGARFCGIRHDFDPDFMYHTLKITETSVIIIDSSCLQAYRSAIERLSGHVHIYVRNETEEKSNYTDIDTILLGNGQLYDIEEAKKVDLNAVGLVNFSSGTTGMPKGIAVPQKSLVNNVAAFTHEAFYPFEKSTSNETQHTAIVTMPQAHAYGIIYAGMALPTRGAQAVMAADPSDVKNIYKAVGHFNPQVIKLNPYIVEAFNEMTKEGSTYLDSVRYMVNTGSSCSLDTFNELNKKTGNKMQFLDVYGATEIGVIAATPLNAQRHRNMSGKLIPHAKCRLVDLETGSPILDVNQHGEIFTQSTWRMEGYISNPKATQDAYDADGTWFHTGDVGYFDENHYLRVVERFKDVIMMKGQKVYSSSFERVLKRHPRVVDVGVVGAPDLVTGSEQPRAFIIPKGEVTEAELVEFVRVTGSPEMRLTGGVRFVDELPRNGLGKLVRKTLRDKTWVGR